MRDTGGASLFLLVGPTGAGKSTVLDAVSLALFGQTPRLHRARGRGETDPALCMSHGTSACRAEVELETLDDEGERVRLRAIWSMRRARGKASGRPQAPVRRLERLRPADGAWEVLVDDDREKLFGPVFDAALGGLTADDFQRSVLLPQGSSRPSCARAATSARRSSSG